VALKKHSATILLDVGLPGGHGLMVMQRLKANTSLECIPGIIVTAEDSQVAELAPSRAAQSRSFKSQWTKRPVTTSYDPKPEN
jgi:CheY-like chemotaxis protein